MPDSQNHPEADSPIQVPPRWRDFTALPAGLYLAEQVRTLDKIAIDGGIPGAVLMKRAARATLAALLQHWPDRQNIVVYCGTGNNGGDGYWIAALAAARGISASILEVGDPGKLQGDAASARQAALQAGLSPQALATPTQLPADAVVVDAMLGTGLSGEVRSHYAAAIAEINTAGLPVVAVDIPSGLCSDSGRVLGEQAVNADLTVTFIGLKAGQFTGDAVNHVGRLVFNDLEVPDSIYQQVAPHAMLGTLDRWRQKIPRRKNNAFKNQSGHLLIVGGDYGMAGAPLMAAMAALRCGAGLVSVATRPGHEAAIVSRQPDIMVHGIDKATQLDALLERATAVVAGPGLGQGPWSQQVLLALNETTVPRLLDADALNLVAANRGLAPASNWVMTPHPGEARRLLSVTGGNKAPADRYAAAAQLAADYSCVSVLKGAGTIIATGSDSAQPSLVCPYGNPGMATAGMGDVLSGVIGSMLAQGLAVNDAAALGVLLHSAAADLAAQQEGQYGLSASDLPGYLRRLLNALVNGQSL